MAIVLRPKGKLDLVGSTSLQQKIDQVVTVSNSQKLWVIDLDGVNEVNHFGLTTLVALRRLAANKGCRLFLRNLNPNVQSMLDIAHLSEEFDILPPDSAIVGEPPLGYVSTTKAKRYQTEVTIENSNPEQESQQAQTQAIGNIRKILSNLKTKLPESEDK
jgi:anti-sigma B factor antagonist